MIYLEETLNLEPAAPSTTDRLVDYAEATLLPICAEDNIRVLAAWFSHTEWFGQVRQVFEFANMTDFAAHWQTRQSDARWLDVEAFMADIAPQRTFNLLEDLGPIPSEVKEQAVMASSAKPLGVYGLAVLNVLPGKMEQMKAGLAQSVGNLPIIASWRPVTGNRNVFIDVWQGPIGQQHYARADDASRSFFGPLRELAPQEKVISVYSLPYSALR